MIIQNLGKKSDFFLGVVMQPLILVTGIFLDYLLFGKMFSSLWLSWIKQQIYDLFNSLKYLKEIVASFE